MYFELLAMCFKNIFLVNTGLCRESTNASCLHVLESEMSELLIFMKALGGTSGIKLSKYCATALGSWLIFGQ